jgi:hypothetical protein
VLGVVFLVAAFLVNKSGKAGASAGASAKPA